MPGNFYTVTLQDASQWPTPNYVDPVQRTWMPGYAIFWQVLSTVFVVGRLYVRIRNQSGSFGLDDILIFCAWAFAVAFTASACLSEWDYDVGRHIWDVRPDTYSAALYWAWISQVVFLHSTCACKTSILLFYRRMAKTSYSPKWLYTVYVLLFITISSWISLFLVWCFMCTPLTSYWDYYYMQAAGDSNYTCLDGDVITIAAGILTVLSDFWSAALPCAMFQSYDLGVSKRQKIALNIIFCLGFLVTGVGIARTYYLWEIGHNEDLSWIGYDLFVSAIVECHLAIICTCAPFFRVLLRRYFPDFTHQSRSNRTATATDTENRHSYLAPTTSSVRAYDPTAQDVNLEHMYEKKGFLLVENGAGRPIWNPQAEESGTIAHHNEYYEQHPPQSRDGGYVVRY